MPTVVLEKDGAGAPNHKLVGVGWVDTHGIDGITERRTSRDGQQTGLAATTKIIVWGSSSSSSNRGRR